MVAKLKKRRGLAKEAALPAAPLSAEASLVEACEFSMRQAREQVERTAKDPEATARARNDASAALSAAVRMLAKVTGQTDVTPQMILRSRYWRRLEEALVTALKAHPAALKDAAAALRGFGEIDSGTAT